MFGVLVCVLFIYTISITTICVSQEEPSLITSNQQMNNLQVNNFWKEKTLWKVNFWYHWIIHLIIACNKGSCCEHITGGANIYLYGCVSLMASECAVCVYVCVISNQSTSKKPHKSDLSKIGACLPKSHIKFLLVLTCLGSTCEDRSIHIIIK